MTLSNSLGTFGHLKAGGAVTAIGQLPVSGGLLARPFFFLNKMPSTHQKPPHRKWALPSPSFHATSFIAHAFRRPTTKDRTPVRPGAEWELRIRQTNTSRPRLTAAAWLFHLSGQITGFHSKLKCHTCELAGEKKWIACLVL